MTSDEIENKKGRPMRNIVGKQFHRWTVIGFSHISKTGTYFWFCRCKCGDEKLIAAQILKNGQSKSCGCLRKEITRNRSSTHKMSKTKTYKTWCEMLRRCIKSNTSNYEY